MIPPPKRTRKKAIVSGRMLKTVRAANITDMQSRHMTKLKILKAVPIACEEESNF